MSSKIKVAHLVLSLEVGGLETFVVNFLSAIDRKRFDISVACLAERGLLWRQIEELGIDVTTFRKREGLDWRMIPRVAKWLRRERADILHTHNAAAHFYGSLGAKFAGVKTVIHTKHGRGLPDKSRKVLLNRISSLFTTKIVTVSANSLEVARDIEKVPARKLITIRNGIDTERFKPVLPGSLPPAIPGIPPGALVIGTVARLSPEKDQKTLIDAFAMLAPRWRNSYLVIAGDGEMREVLESHARTLSCSDRIKFLGQVDNAPAILRALDVFVLTSLTEGIPLSLLEAASSCVPAVVTDAGGNGEVVVDGVTGFVVPKSRPEMIAERIELLLGDQQQREVIGEKARERILSEFSLKRTTSDYESLYTEYHHGSRNN